MAPRGVSTWRRPYTSIYNDNFRYGTGLYSDTLSDIEKRYSESLNRTQLRSDRPDLAFTSFSGSNLTSSPNPVGESSGRENAFFSRRPPQSPSPAPEIARSPTFENRLNATLKSAASALGEDVEDAVNARIERRKAAIARSMSESRKNDAEEDDFSRRLEIRKRALARVMSQSEDQSRGTDSDEYVSKSRKTTEQQQALRPTSLYDEADLWTLPKRSDKLSELDLDTPKSRRKAGGGQTTTTTNGPSSRWREKSRTLQDQVDSLEKSMSDGSSRLKNELSSLKSKYHSELYDLSGSVENTTQQASDLQRICRKQDTQLKDLQTAYDSAQRNIEDVLEEMNIWQNKCKSLKKDMDRLREEVEMAVSKKSKD